MQDLKPSATYKAYVEDVIKEKLLIYIDIIRDPQAAIENQENNPKA